MSGGSGSMSPSSSTGQAAANNAAYGTGGTNPFVPIARQAQSNLWGGILGANNYAAGLEPQRESLMNQIIGQLSGGGIQAAAAKSRNNIFQNATQGGNQAAMALKGQGYGDGVSGGMLGAMLGQGVTQANASDQHYSDPSYIASILGQGVGAIGEGMQNPLAGIAEGYEPYITNQNQTNYDQRGQGLLGSIAPILGSYLGGQGGAGLFGHAGGSGMTGPFISGPAGLGRYYANQNADAFDDGF